MNSGYASEVTKNSATRGAPPADEALRSAVAVYELLASFIRLGPRDLSLTSLSALSTLQRGGPRRVTDLAASEGIAQPSVTALVGTLEKAGLVERRSVPSDKRVVIIAITEAGSAYLSARRAAGAESFSQAVGKLSPEDATTLLAAVPVIERLRELIDEQRDAS